MAITRYAGDRFTIGAGETKPTGVLDGAVLIDTGNLELYVKRDGVWVEITGVGTDALPGAPLNSVQFNNAGAFGGDADLTFTDGNRLNVNKLGISGNIYDSNNSIGDNGMVLTNEGATGVNWKAIEDVLSGVGGSGVTNYVARWADEDTLTTGVLVDNGTNVGINVPSPNFPLEISSSGNATVRIEDTTNNSRLDLRAEDSAVLIRSTSNFPMRFDVNQTERMRIDTAGNVGIGTNSPQTKLHLNGGSTSLPIIRLQRNDTSVVPDDLIGGFENYSNDADGAFISSYIKGYATETYGRQGYLTFGTAGTNSTDASEKMRIAGDGNVGIGVTNLTQHKLQVDGQIGGSLYTASFISFPSSGGSAGNTLIKANDNVVLGFSQDVYIKQDGKVGIGTNNPSYRLDIGGATSSTGHTLRLHQANGGTAIRVGPGGGGNDITLLRVDGTNSNNSGTTDSSNVGFSLKYMGSRDGNLNALSIFTDNVTAASQIEAVTILQDGYVGIGTTSPERSLHIFKGESSGAASNSDSALVLENSTHTYLQFLTPATSQSGILFGDSDNDRGALTYSHTTDSMNFAVAASTRMTITSSGNVGIGTITPNARLDVSVNSTSDVVIRVANEDNTTSTADAYLHVVTGGTSSGNVFTRYNILGSCNWSTGIDNSDSDKYKISFSSNLGTNDYVTVKQDGKVGIGIPDPLNPLDVVGYIKSSIGFKAGNYTTMLESGNESIFGNTAYYGVLFKTNNATRMKITNAGNVGIGTTVPSQKLHVQGNLRVTGAYYASDNNAGSSNQVLTSTGSGGTDWKSLSQIGDTVTGDGTTNKITKWENGPDSDLTDSSFLSESGTTLTNTATVTEFTTTNTQLRLPNYGRIAIGAASTNSVLLANVGDNATFSNGEAVIKGENSGNRGTVGHASGSDLLRLNFSDALGMILNKDGHVGIGTDPKAKFEVDLNQTSGTLAADNYAHFGGQHNASGSVMGITLGYREANLLYRKVGIVARGIGDIHARQDLDFLVSTATGSTSVTPSDAKLTISGLTGNVGIGTTVPSQQLHLTGSIRMPNTTSTTTGIIYKDTSRFIHNYQHPTGDTAVPAGFNTFVGISAGSLSMGSTATAAAEGSYNSGFGYQVLTSLTTGYSNTAVGFKAGNDITTAIDSTLVGMNAGGNIVNGSRNTFIGDDAGFLTTSGANNVTVGSRTLRSNTTGSNNTILGTYALDAHTSPAGHTTLGYSALTNLTTGSYNIAIGYAAGSQKVATGNLTNASYGIYLGHAVDGTEAASGEIVIGKDAKGLGSNTTRLGGSNITKTVIEYGNVGIGTLNPIGKLHIYQSTGSANYLEANPSTEDSSLGNIYGRWNGSNAGLISFRSGSDTTNKDNGDIAFYTSTAGGSLVRAMTIDENQKVGIGTTSPVASLHVRSSETNIARFSGLGTAGTYIKLDESGTQAWVMGIDNGDTTLKIRKNDYNGDVSVSFASDQQVQFNAYGSGTFTGTATQRLAVDSSGNIIEVPIGSGAVDGSGAANKVTYWTDTDTISYNNNFHWDNTNGNLGIGTDVPNSTLHVYTTAEATARFQSTDNKAEIYVYDNDTTAILGAETDHIYLGSSTGSANGFLRINTNTGNANFGATPEANTRLKIVPRTVEIASNSTNYQKAVYASGLNFYDINSGVTDSGYRIAVDASVFVSDADFEGTLADQYAIWARHGANVSAAGSTITRSIGVYIDSLTNANTTITNLYGLYQEDSVAKNYFSGSVGIGTTSSGSKLHVNGGSKYFGGGDWTTIERVTTTEGNYALYVQTTGTNTNQAIAKFNYGCTAGGANTGTTVAAIAREKSYFLSKLGIGTASPNHELEVAGGGDATIRITSTSTNISDDTRIGTLQYFSSDTSSNTVVGEIVSRTPVANFGNVFDMAFSTYKVNSGALSEKMRITGGGNVGIGITDPQAQLHINGGDLDTRAYQQNSSTNSIYLNPTNGNATGTSNTVGGGVIWKTWYNNYTKKSAGILAIGEGNYFRSGLAFYTNNNANQTTDWSERMRIAMDGNVGIGTTSADLKLHINNAGGSPNTRFSRGTGYIFDLKIDNIITDSVIDYIIEPNQASSGILFRTHNSSNTNINALAINRDGDVGIGTLNPLQKLHVVGSTLISNNNYHYGYTSGGAQASLVGIKSNNYVTIGQLNANNVGTDIYGGTGNIYLYSGSTNRLTVSSDVNIQGATDLNINGPSRRLRFTSGTGTIRTTTSNNLILQTNSISAITIYPTQQVQFNAYGSGTFTGTATQRLAVDSSGNVIEVPIGSGAVDGSGAANKVTYWTDTDTISYNNNFHWDNTNGNLGVGTATPAATVQIVDSTSGASVLKVDGTNGTLFEVVDDLSGSLMSVNDAAGLPVFEVFADNHIVAGRYNQNDFYLNTSGNLGLGTSSPITKLNIKGDQSANGQLYIEPTNDGEYAGLVIKTTRGADRAYAIFAGGTGTDDLNFRFRDASAGADRMVIDSSGNVGIGAVSPSAKLHVKEANSGLSSFDGTADTLILESNANGGMTIVTAAANTGRIIFASPNDATGAEIKYSDATDLMTIGTTNPDADLALQAGNGVQAVRILDDGNVGIGTTNPSVDFSVKEHLLFNDTTRLLTISNNTNTGGINLDGGNSRLYFSGYRALEGNNSGTTLTVGEGYGTTRISSVLNVVDHETILSPDQGSSGGVTSRALTIENINDSNWTADALTAYNATTGYDIRDRASLSFFARPTQGSILTYASETANQGTLHRFVNLNSSATEPLYRWDFYQYDGSGTGNDNFKVPDKLFQIRVREGASEVEKFTIKGNGKVGIGINNPSNPLHVESGDNVLATFESTDANATLYLKDSNTTASSTFKRITNDLAILESGGNVGIGTVIPGGKLHVYGGTTAFTNLSDNTDSVQITRNTSVHSHQDAKLFIYDNSNSDWAQKISLDGYSYGLRIDGWVDYGLYVIHNTLGDVLVARSSELVINESGNDYNFRVEGDTDVNLLKCDAGTDSVGIGGSPNSSYKLDVSGDTLIQESESGDLKLVVNNVSTSTLARSAVSLINNTGSSAGLTLPSTNYTGVTGWANRLILNTDSNISNGILVRPSTGGFTVSANGLANTNLRVDTNGKVGVNTASPANALTVAGDIGYTGYLGQGSIYGNAANASYARVQLYDPATGYTTFNNISYGYYFQTANSTKVTILNNGNVGIGTPSPGAKLDINDTGQNQLLVRGWSFDGAGASAGAIQIGGTNAYCGRIWVDNTSTKLHIANTYNSGNGDIMFHTKTSGTTIDAVTIKGSGNVGIGTTLPSQKLHVQGTLRLTGAFYDSNNAAGTSGQVLTSTGSATDWKDLDEISGVTASNPTTTNYVTKWSDGTNEVITDSLIYDNGTNVGIGTATPLGKLDILRLSSAEPGLIARANRDGAKMNFAYTNSNSMGEIGTTYYNSTGAMRLWIGGNLNSNSTGHVGPTQQGTSSSSWFSEYNTSNDYYQINRIAAGGGTSSSTLFYITSAGNVGIGGVTPTLGKLQVAGRGYFGPVGTGDATTKALMDTYSVLKLKPHDSNSTNMTFAQVNSGAGIGIQVTNGTQTANWDIALNPYGGNVSIGTPSPALQSGGTGLHINDTTNSELKFTNNTTGATASDGTALVASGSSFTLNNREAGSIKLGTSNTTRVTIDSAGKVGIGTPTPDVKLEVVDSPTDGIIADFVNATNAGGTTAAIKLSNADSEACDVVLGANRVNANFGSDFFISLSDNVDGTNQERFRITEAGNVGIGTVSPTSKLQVVDSHFDLTAANKNGISITDDAFGIGLFTPALGFGYNGNFEAGLAGVYGSADNNQLGLMFFTHPSATSSADSVEAMRITYDGKVGIGTTDPITKLHIAEPSAPAVITLERTDTTVFGGNSIGYINFRGGESTIADVASIEVWSQETWNPDDSPTYMSFYTTPNASTSKVEAMRIDMDGNVGIGTTNPGVKLHVNGNAVIGDASQTSNILTIRATNTAGSPAATAQILMEGYEGRGIGTFYTDSTYSGEEWFCGMNYSGNFNSWNIGYDLAGGQAEYLANTLFQLHHNGKLQLHAYGAGTFTGTATQRLAVDASGNVIEIAGGIIDGSGTEDYVARWTDTDTLGIGKIRDDNSTVAINTAPDSSYMLKVAGNGYFSGTLTEASSLAIKENIENFTPSIDKINKIRPVKYNKKGSDKKEIGLIAEELEELFPELVEKDENGNPSGVNYSRAVTVLLGGFKELYKELQEIKKRI